MSSSCTVMVVVVTGWRRAVIATVREIIDRTSQSGRQGGSEFETSQKPGLGKRSSLSTTASFTLAILRECGLA